MNENTMLCEKQMHLPQDLLSEILSRLDVDSLLRFKAVCKEWCCLIEDQSFIRSHMMKSRGHWVFETVVDRGNYDSYGFLDSCFGLVLEYNYITQNPRLRNPSTRKILELPHPGKYRPEDMKMCRTKSSDVLKLVVRTEYNDRNHWHGRIVCKVLTVGIDMRWRDIDIPFPPSGYYGYCGKTIMVREVYLMLFLTDNGCDHYEVICLKVANEETYSIKIPNLFMSNRFNHDVRALAWGESLALVRALEDEVHIWVLDLEDHKEIRLAEKMIVVPLKFADPDRFEGVFVLGFKDNGLLVHFDGEELLLLDIPSGKVKQRFLTTYGQEFAYYYLISSLEHPSLRK